MRPRRNARYVPEDITLAGGGNLLSWPYTTDDVPPFYHVDGCVDRAREPQIGVTIQGRRIDVTIDEVVAAEGVRVPPANKAPHSFNMAFVLVGPPGQFPSEESIAKVDRLRAAWEPHFTQITNGLGTVSTKLKMKPRR